ncbi:uncharacterized protein LOC142355058 [Convolutriloba macropyga]|uniref:uncharacterized protein LOC142355058 n=1 Tax=Convolutriloba macropyga TaxID=536237 RepID=UPI003F52543F
MKVCESHTTAGGVAHSFKRGGYEFDSGPSFYLGLSDPKGQSTNSLKNVLDLLDEPLPCATYDRWTMYLPEGQFDCIVDPDVYASQLEKFAGAEGVAQWRALEAQLQPLADFAGGIPFGAIRTDPWVALSMMKYLPSVPGRATELFRACGGLESMVGQLEGPFSDMVEDAGVTQPFVKKMLDLESFVISGTLASGMPAPEMAYMYAERHKKGAVLDYPVGGSQAYIDALVRGIEKYGGTVQLGSHVEEVVVEDGRAVGVRIRNRAEVLRAKQAVVANLSVWDLPKLLKGPVASELQSAASQVPECESFLHLHAGLDATGLPPPEELGIHHLVVRDWELGVDGPLNIINISIPTALDPSLAPPGKHTVHVYGAANESFDTWAGLDRSSPEYAALKASASCPTSPGSLHSQAYGGIAPESSLRSSASATSCHLPPPPPALPPVPLGPPHPSPSPAIPCAAGLNHALSAVVPYVQLLPSLHLSFSACTCCSAARRSVGKCFGMPWSV